MRWQGSVQAPVDGRITFAVSAAAGDNVRFAVALPDTHQPAGRMWQDVVVGSSAGQELTGSVELVRGETYAVLMEWQHATGPAALRLTWEYAGAGRTPIPVEALFPREPLSISYLGRAWLPVRLANGEPARTALTTTGPRLRYPWRKATRRAQWVGVCWQRANYRETAIWRCAWWACPVPKARGRRACCCAKARRTAHAWSVSAIPAGRFVCRVGPTQETRFRPWQHARPRCRSG